MSLNPKVDITALREQPSTCHLVKESTVRDENLSLGTSAGDRRLSSHL